MLVMMASVDGMMRAAPTPMLARAVISIPVELEKAAQADPPEKATSPASRVSLRPTRSATLPAVSRRQPKTSA